MKSPLDPLLNLSGVTVAGRSQVEGFICFHLQIVAAEIDCSYCGQSTKELHQIRPILVRAFLWLPLSHLAQPGNLNVFNAFIRSTDDLSQ